MKPTNKNPNEFERLARLRKFDQDLTINQNIGTQNLLSVAMTLVKCATANELILAVSESYARVIDLIYKVNRDRKNTDEMPIDLNTAIMKDSRMVFQLSTLLDAWSDSDSCITKDISESYREVYRRAGEMIQQDLFYLAEEYEKINFNIFETDDELPF